ncbi:MAG: hypothetical protein ACD_22C00184G0013 [uncultured bacterium]|nr:MAG: hypothetical protein ACD_22C00184G0013 [uncultured bacterium]
MPKSAKITLNIPKWRKNPSAIKKFRFVYHFLPHPEHGTRAKLLSSSAMVLYILLFFGLFAGFKLFTHIYPGVLGYASDISIKQLYELTNSQRETAGLEPLRLNTALTAAAENKAKDMFKNNYWAHISPTGTEPWDFILGANYDYSYAGENLAKNFSNSRDVVDAWYNSPSHRENLLNKNYDEIGFAVVNGVLDGYETTLVVQMFGKPRDPSLLASAEEGQRILDSYSTQSGENSAVVKPASALTESPFAITPVVSENKSVLPAVSVTLAIKGLAVVFILFLISLLLLDIWYSARHAIVKVSGHSLAHLIFLIVSVTGMLFALLPGKIL